jgi:hypothetical protein
VGAYSSLTTINEGQASSTQSNLDRRASRRRSAMEVRNFSGVFRRADSDKFSYLAASKP